MLLQSERSFYRAHSIADDRREIKRFTDVTIKIDQKVHPINMRVQFESFKLPPDSLINEATANRLDRVHS
jgi:hypothetical protein